MTESEEFYHRLIELDPALRRRWLLDHRPASVSAAHWWMGLIDSAVTDVRHTYGGGPPRRARADLDLAASLIEWAAHDGFPLRHAVEQLAELTRLALDAGRRVQDLPRNTQPDRIARQAITGFAMTPQQAMSRAAGLRASPTAQADLPSHNLDLSAWQTLTASPEHRDYHHLLDIGQMLTVLAPLVGLIVNADLAAELRLWLEIQSNLDPLPTDADPFAAEPGQPG